MDNPITLQEQRKVWTIHQSVNGITYYYNRSTKKSQYEMPECFKITEEDLDHPDWKQYRTAEGKKFYYNALTRKSCWHMPAEVKQWKMKIEDQKRAERERNGNREEQPLSEADQIKKKFMLLLKTKNININTKWDVCISLCEDDQRWDLLKISDKKKYFQQYVSQLRKINELEFRAKTEANRVQFLKMLRQHKNLTSDCKMHKIQFDFITDPRWRILDGADKENAFQDYMDELLAKQKEQARKERQRNMETLKLLIEEKQIKYDKRWDDFRAEFKDQQCFKKLSDLDRINVFTKYIIQAEQRNQQKEKKQKRMKQRTDRAQFRNMIKTKLLDGQINYKSKWRSFVKDFKDDVRLLNMMDPDYKGSSAHQIFQNFMEPIRKNHKIYKNEIKIHFKKVNFRMVEETNINQFSQKLSDLPLFAESKQVIKEYFFSYFRQKIKSKNLAKQQKQKQKERQKQALVKKMQKKQKKAIFKIFKQYNQNTKSKYAISDHIEKIEQNLKQLSINITRQNIFKYYLAYLQSADADDDKKSKDSQKSQRAKSRSKSSSSSRSNSEKKKKKKKESEKQKDKEKEREKDKQKERDRDRDREKDSNKKQSKNNITNGLVKSIAIPNELRQMKDENQIEEQGQIKDDQFIQKVEKVKEPEKNKERVRDQSKSRQKEKSKDQKKKKKSAKKKKVSSSSDSD